MKAKDWGNDCYFGSPIGVDIKRWEHFQCKTDYHIQQHSTEQNTPANFQKIQIPQ